MPIYHHHLRTPDGPERDETGIDHPNLEAAYLETVRTIPLLCVELMGEGRDPSGWVFEIADPSGRVLMEVPFWERMRTGAPTRPCASLARDATLRMAGDTVAARGTAAIRASRQIRAEAASTIGFVRQAVSASMEMRVLSRHAARERADGHYRPDGAKGNEIEGSTLFPPVTSTGNRVGEPARRLSEARIRHPFRRSRRDRPDSA